jgi:hypothetical protein
MFYAGLLIGYASGNHNESVLLANRPMKIFQGLHHNQICICHISL